MYTYIIPELRGAGRRAGLKVALLSYRVSSSLAWAGEDPVSIACPHAHAHAHTITLKMKDSLK